MTWNTVEKQRLLNAFLELRTVDEARCFLRDLMTESEIDEFARRLQAATMLAETVPYTRIVKTTKLSSTTVARVSKWLQGTAGGYRLVLGRLHHPRLSRVSG